MKRIQTGVPGANLEGSVYEEEHWLHFGGAADDGEWIRKSWANVRNTFEVKIMKCNARGKYLRSFPK